MRPNLTSPAATAPLIEAIRTAKRLYVDTEFHAEHRYMPRLYLLQVAVDDGPVWLVDCSDLAAVAVLGQAMCSVPWVVHGGRSDMVILNDLFGGLPERVWDTQILAGLVQPAFPSPFQRLVSQWLNIDLAKTATLTDWKKRPLSAEQLSYAQADVAYLRPLFERLMDKVSELDRVQIAGAACDQARDSAIEGTDPDQAWRSLGAAWTLNGTQASVLRELAAWRERTGKADNQPPRRIAGDGLLFELAKRLPSSVHELANDRRIPWGVIKRHGEEMLLQVRLGERRHHIDPPPLIRRFSVQATTATWLQAVAQIRGLEQSWSPDLLLPKSLNWDLVLSSQSRQDVAALLAWRDPLFGDVAHRALRGPLSVHRSDDSWSVA